IDSRIAEINTKAKKDYDGYKKEMTKSLGISSSEIDRYVNQDKIDPGDVFYGGIIAKETNRSLSDVMKKYKSTRSWGKVSKELGIKQGSDQFHNLKKNTLTKPGNTSIDKNKDQIKTEDKKQNQVAPKKIQDNTGKPPVKDNGGKK
ncbi:MAG TPA: hypothetical protein VH917_01160, partial [Ignavibacteriaceae bacterium]